MERSEISPPLFSRTVFRERTHTLGSTAIITDKLRESIAIGDFDDLDSASVYYSIHLAHSMGNSGRAYVQESYSGKRKSHTVYGSNEGEKVSDLDPGQLRSVDCHVGDYCCCPISVLEPVVRGTFEAIDALRTNKEEVRTFSLDQRLLLLTTIDALLTLGHFVRNASGRTNEEFLVFLAREFGLSSFSISSSGFRGQAGEGLELEVEKARWLIRNEMIKEVLINFFHGISLSEVAEEIQLIPESCERGATRAFLEEVISILEARDVSVQDLCWQYYGWSNYDLPKTLVLAASYYRPSIFAGKAHELLNVLKSFASKRSARSINKQLRSSQFWQAEYQVFKEALSQEYHYLPQDEQVQFLLTQAAACVCLGRMDDCVEALEAFDTAEDILELAIQVADETDQPLIQDLATDFLS